MNANMEGTLRVAVIGSGLAALGAVKGLIARGIKPVVLDRGERLEKDREEKAAQMAAVEPSQWTPEQRVWLTPDGTPKDGSGIPKKREFGSEYFYGRSLAGAPVKSKDTMPPFSYALGGLSAGWGAAVLPPQACDLEGWPVEAGELAAYGAKALEGLPYSAEDDGLSLDFPLLSPGTGTLRLGVAGRSLLEALGRTGLLQKGRTVFGRARQLIQAQGEKACRYCGHCMSGCVYGSIFRAGDEILRLQKEGKLDYVPGCLVEGLAEEGGKALVTYRNAQGAVRTEPFDRIFLAAGAVNSTRLVAASKGNFGASMRLRTRGGFVLPALSLKGLPAQWPDCNTEPGIFLDLKGGGLKHWVHVQVSTENELVLKKLGLLGNAKGPWTALKRFLSRHLFLLFVNYHSDHSGTYEMSLEPLQGDGKPATLVSRHVKKWPSFGVLGATVWRLLGVFGRIGCLPLFPLARLNSGSYHVGGTMPMTEGEPRGFRTDRLGRVAGWENIHVVDSSIFPSLPGTTIGLLLMGNAYRIADQAFGKD